MNRDQKAAVVEQIAADISAAEAIFAIDYRGITVAQADALRGRLRDANANFRVVKNSLTERAADQAGAEALKPLLEGPTALTFVRGDAAAAAKAIADFARTTQLLAFKGGLMDGAALSAAEITSISRLPSRDVLYGQLVGLIASPIAGLARTLSALIGGLAVGLGGVLEQKQADPAFAAPVSEATEPAAAAAAPPSEAPAEAEAEAESAARAAEEADAASETPPAVEAEAAPEAETAADGDSAADPVEAGEDFTTGDGPTAGETEGAAQPAPDPPTTDDAAPKASDDAADEPKEN
jgi:large subunit ribosomal protein L10